jgi:hypothetical protein
MDCGGWNPSIFEKAIADSHDYDEEIRALALAGKDANAIYETLSQRDVQSAADEFRPLYDRTDAENPTSHGAANSSTAMETRFIVPEQLTMLFISQS